MKTGFISACIVAALASAECSYVAMPKGCTLKEQEKMVLRGLELKSCMICDVKGGVPCTSQPAEQAGLSCPDAGLEITACLAMPGSGPISAKTASVAKFITPGQCGSVKLLCVSTFDSTTSNYVSKWTAQGGSEINSSCGLYSRCQVDIGECTPPPPSEPE